MLTIRWARDWSVWEAWRTEAGGADSGVGGCVLRGDVCRCRDGAGVRVRVRAQPHAAILGRLRTRQPSEAGAAPLGRASPGHAAEGLGRRLRANHGTPVSGQTTGPTCEQDYLLINPPGDLGSLCEQDQVYAEAGAGPDSPASIPSPGYPVLGRGALPTVAGMRGAWEELDVGVSAKYAAYQVIAGYEAANHKLFYELIVTPPLSYPGICHGSGPQARATARQFARSFRVAVTDPSTAGS